MTFQIIMHKPTPIIPYQLRPLNLPIEKQTLRIPPIKRNALASRERGSALIQAAFERAVGFSFDDFGVVAWDLGEARDSAEWEAGFESCGC